MDDAIAQKIFEKLDKQTELLNNTNVAIARVEENCKTLFKNQDDHSEAIDKLQEKEAVMRGGIKVGRWITGVLLGILSILEAAVYWNHK